MPSFPTSVFNPATKTTGQTIQAAHVNDLQDEVVAIESGYLTGTARLNAGDSTLASLNVTGNSTLNNLSVSGGSTFSGTMTFAGPITMSSGGTVSTGVLRQNSIPAWSVYYDSTQTTATTSPTALLFNQQDRVSGNIGFGAASTTTRVTINTTGWYQINAHVQVESGTDPGPIVAILRQDGATDLLAAVAARSFGTSQSAQSIDFGQLMNFPSTCYLEIVAHTPVSGAGSTFGSTIAARRNRFSGFFVG